MATYDALGANALLWAVWEASRGTRKSGFPQLLFQMAQNPQDYAILAPVSSFLEGCMDLDTGKTYKDLTQEVDFLLAHVIRISALKEAKIRANGEYSTLNGRSLVIRNDLVMNGKGWKHDFAVRISSQRLVSFPQKDSVGCLFHVVFIEEALLGNPKVIAESKVKLLLESDPRRVEVFEEPKHEIPRVVGFDFVLEANPGLSELFPKFHQAMSDVRPKQCDTLGKLHNEFKKLVNDGMEIVSGISSSTLDKVYDTGHVRDRRSFELSLLCYLERNVYDRIFAQIVRLHEMQDDDVLEDSYDYLRYVSITQVGLSSKLMLDPDTRNELIIRTNAAISCFKTLPLEKTCIGKCAVVLDTVKLLTSDVEGSKSVSKLDADSILCLLIYVICHAQVPHLPSQMYYLHTYFNHLPVEKTLNLGSGYVGYVLSTLEIAINYFYDISQREGLIKHGQANCELWGIIKEIKPSRSLSRNKEKRRVQKENRKLLYKLDEVLQQLYEDTTQNEPDLYWTSSLFARDTQGRTYLSLSVNKRNDELMNVVLGKVTIDDLLEEVDIKGRTLLGSALELNHTISGILVGMLLASKVSDKELRAVVNRQDYRLRSVGHVMSGLKDWKFAEIGRLLDAIDWGVRDMNGVSPLMSLSRAYDHHQYEEVMCMVIDKMRGIYKGVGGYKLTLDHMDSKGNGILQGIRSPIVMRHILEAFPDSEIDVNHMNDAGMSSLCLCVKYSRMETLAVLIKDPRVDIKRVDARSYMGVMDYIKLENHPSERDREVQRLVENRWCEQGENGDYVAVCLRGRFEQDRGFCLHMRVGDETVVVQYGFLKKMFKIMRVECGWIPFVFDREWIPGGVEVEMKGNILSSNKLKINTLVENVNVVWSCLQKMGVLDSVGVWRDVVTNSERCIYDDLALIKVVRGVATGTRAKVLVSAELFRSAVVSKARVESYGAFVNFSIRELNEFLVVYEGLYVKLCEGEMRVEGSEAADVSIGEKFGRRLHARMQWPRANIALARLRVLCALTRDLVSVQLTLKGKLIRWLKLAKGLVHLRGEFTKLEEELRGNAEGGGEAYEQAALVSLACCGQINALLGETQDGLEELREDLSKNMLSNSTDTKSTHGSHSSTAAATVIGETSTETLSYIQKRRVAYVNKLVRDFVRLRGEVFDVGMDVARGYERVAEFVSAFYAFKVEWTELIFKELAQVTILSHREVFNRMVNKRVT